VRDARPYRQGIPVSDTAMLRESASPHSTRTVAAPDLTSSQPERTPMRPEAHCARHEPSSAPLQADRAMATSSGPGGKDRP